MIRLRKIEVRDTGPIRRFSLDAGHLNLIYGPNEMGKTCLVEWIIDSLFRNARSWGLRDMPRSGKLHVEGLDTKPVIMTPGKGRKLEDYWEEGQWGLPLDFSRLLVVKGAEVEFGNGKNVDRTVIKQYLSHQQMLDVIDSRIDKTIQDAGIADGRIEGAMRGAIKNRESLISRRQQIQQLFQQIDEIYSGGDRRLLQLQLKEIEGKLKEQESARRHRAYLLSREADRLRDELGKIDEKRLQTIRDQIHLRVHKQSEYDSLKSKVTQTREKCLHYTWLKNAADSYEKLLDPPHLRLPLLFGLGAVCMAAALTLWITGIHLQGRIALGMALLFMAGHALQWRRQLRYWRHDRERAELQEEFKSRFKRPLANEADIKSLLESMEEFHSAGRIYEKQKTEMESFLEEQNRRIQAAMMDLQKQEVPSDEWMETLASYEQKVRELHKAVSETERELASLQVDPSDYREQPAEGSYSRRELDALQRQKEQFRKNLEAENQKLENLKAEIYHMIKKEKADQEKAANWEELIDQLKKTREALDAEYKSLTADILGKIIVHDIIRDLRKSEDEKIQDGLSAPEVTETVYALTGRYQHVRIENDQIRVGDETGEYALNQLSTGAREQVLLALRVAFSRRLVKEPMFLILDDAFQYSDWKRRQLMMKTVMKLVQAGWQIFYFTMDDHIQGLFQKHGKSLGAEFKSVVLEAVS